MALITLVWHRVLPDDIYALFIDIINKKRHMYTKQSFFVQTIQTILESNIPIIHPGEIDKYRLSSDNHGYLFTFDDSSESHVLSAKILQHYKINGLFFIGCLSSDKHTDDFTSLRCLPRMLTLSDLQSMIKNDCVTIGGHSKNHIDLTRVQLDTSMDEVYKEIYINKQELEKIVQKKIDFFAYPYGKFKDVVSEQVKKAGYSYAFSVIPEWSTMYSDIYTMGRFDPQRSVVLNPWRENAAPIYCPICNNTQFVRKNMNAKQARHRVRCSKCRAIARHRAVNRILRVFSDMLEKSTVLQFSNDASCYGIKIIKHYLSQYDLSCNTDSFLESEKIQHIDACNIHVGDCYFDAIIANHVLETIEDDELAFREIMRTLKGNGFFIFTNLTSPSSILPDKEKTGSLRSYGYGEVVKRFSKYTAGMINVSGFDIIEARTTSVFLAFKCRDSMVSVINKLQSSRCFLIKIIF